MRRPIVLLIAVALSGLPQAGCDKKRRKVCPRYTQVRQLPSPPAPQIVAEVNGRPIAAAAVGERMDASALDRRAALESLIADELLFQEAERRGLHRDKAVLERGKAAAIYQLVQATFEADYTPASVPESELRRVYKIEAPKRFIRPELRRFAHAYFTRPWYRVGRKWQLDVKQDETIKALLARFRQKVDAGRPADHKAFEALAEDLELDGEALKTQVGLMNRKGLRKSFADALWALSELGRWTDVIQTRRWYHVAYLVEIMPALNISFADAEPLIRSKVYPWARKKAFKRWVAELASRCSIKRHPEHLPVQALDTQTALPPKP